MTLRVTTKDKMGARKSSVGMGVRRERPGTPAARPLHRSRRSPGDGGCGGVGVCRSPQLSSSSVMLESQGRHTLP
jgi:hypothetical protein